MHIKLKDTFYFSADGIESVQFFRQDGQPCVQVGLKRQDLCDFIFRGDEATEVWNNWTAYMERVENEHRGGAK
jgi:hypothetical protein